MPKTITILCDGCGNAPDMRKNFLTVVGHVFKFHPTEGPKEYLMEKYFCHICSEKIINVMGEMEKSE